MGKIADRQSQNSPSEHCCGVFHWPEPEKMSVITSQNLPLPSTN
jgi:hypothetical protein